jgi:crotonobetainyl-CoA:carnitine CoA-transferase CaiB-like acyl-CoA transferase
MLGLQNEREWKLFCDVALEDPALAADPRFDANPRRNANREALRAIIVSAFSALGTAQVVERLERAGIANATMNDMAGLWAHPQLQARQRWRTVGSPAGDIPALLPPGRSNRWEARMDPIPAIGEHTGALLREAGLDDAAIAALTLPAVAEAAS